MLVSDILFSYPVLELSFLSTPLYQRAEDYSMKQLKVEGVFEMSLQETESPSKLKPQANLKPQAKLYMEENLEIICIFFYSKLSSGL